MIQPMNLSNNDQEQTRPSHGFAKALGSAVVTAAMAVGGVGSALAQFGGAKSQADAPHASAVFTAGFKDGMTSFSQNFVYTPTGMKLKSGAAKATMTQDADDLDRAADALQAGWAGEKDESKRGYVAGLAHQTVVSIDGAIAAMSQETKVEAPKPVSVSTSGNEVFSTVEPYVNEMREAASATRAVVATIPDDKKDGLLDSRFAQMAPGINLFAMHHKATKETAAEPLQITYQGVVMIDGSIKVLKPVLLADNASTSTPTASLRNVAGAPTASITPGMER